MYRRLGKRILDFTAAACLFVVTLPVMLLIALFVRIQMGTPVLFQQQRAGKGGRLFQVQKFRTMNNRVDAQGELLPDADRLTATGKFLRSTSLDELPQLINVLRGDMSLIGPRPLLVEYLPRYNPEQARRHEVLPGITGWAQVNGRNTLAWEDRFQFDVYYVDHVSLWLDCKILLLTLRKVLMRSDVNSETHATMERFMGTPKPKE